MKPRTNLLAIDSLVLCFDDQVFSTCNMYACGQNFITVLEAFNDRF